MRLLLDAHISPSIARQLHQDGLDAVALRHWQDGNYRTATDETVLITAMAEERVLVTYDLRTIPSLLKEWAEMGQHHGGVILVDERTLRPNDIPGLLRALRFLERAHGNEAWRDRAVFLQAREP